MGSGACCWCTVRLGTGLVQVKIRWMQLELGEFGCMRLLQGAKDW